MVKIQKVKFTTKGGKVVQFKQKVGALRKDLSIPNKKLIPLALLNKIIAAKAGDTVTNPTSIGKKRIMVTRELERRAIRARTLKKIRR